MTMLERWLPIGGFEGYEVSDHGRVRSIDRVLKNGRTGTRFHVGQILKLGVTPRGRGYWAASLRKNGRNHQVPVHRLVALTFIGPRPVGLEICHNNGDSFDNRIENLRYDTHSANELDKVRHGTHFPASNTHCKYGHEFTPENTKLYGGKRRCLTCLRAIWRARRLKRQQATAAA